ncbi:MAG: DUF2299 domain-containing protein [Euryarchaeota archaeon]|nr:DUF2299 domain-containing protein [Euryarchaeota archaeon]
MTKIEDRVQKWLSDEGLFRQKVADGSANFHFVINFPEGNIIDVFQPKGKNDLIVIGCATNVSPEHLSEIKKLSDKEREDFIWDLRFMLNTQSVDFQFQHPENVLQNFIISKEIFEDGLTKDRLISSIKKVFRAKLQCIWKIQKEFGPGEERRDISSDSMYV